MASWARRVHAREEQQLDTDKPLPFASLASALRNVEREPARIVPPHTSRLRRREQLSNVVEQPCVSRQVRPGSAANRLLIHAHQTLDLLDPANEPSPGRDDRSLTDRIRLFFLRGNLVPQMRGNKFHEHLTDKARLPRTRHTCHGRKQSNGER